MSADRNLDFLLSLCAKLVGSEPDPVPEAPADLSWDRVLAYASRFRVLPLLGWKLSTDARMNAPYWLRSTAVAVYRDTRVTTALLQSLARDLAAEANERGIRLAFRKGLHLCMLYPEPGCRFLADIDVFTSPEDLPGLLEVAKALGWTERPMRREERHYLRLATNASPPLVWRRGADEVELDPATSLLLPTMQGAEDPRLFEAALRRSTTDGVPYPVLGRSDLLLDLLLNLYVNCTTLRYVHMQRFQRLSHYLDVLLVAAALEAEDWAAFDEAVSEHGAARAAAFGFGSCLALFPEEAAGSQIERRAREADAKLLDSVGELELPIPYVWRRSLRERLVRDSLPDDLPRPEWPTARG